MLGLGEQIGRHPRGIGSAVGNDQHLARTGQEVDGDASEELAFGLDHIAVAGAENFVDRGDRLGAEGQRGHGLRTAHAVNLGRAGQRQGSEQSGAHFAIGAGGGYCDNFLHPCGCRKGAGHQCGRDQRCRPAGNIETDPPERIETLSRARALRVARAPGTAQTFRGEFFDVAVCGNKRATRWRIESAPCGGKFFGRHADLSGRQFGSAEFFGQTQQRRITLFADRLDDAAHGFFHGGSGHGTAVESAEKSGVVFVTRTDDAHGGMMPGRGANHKELSEA